MKSVTSEYPVRVLSAKASQVRVTSPAVEEATKFAGPDGGATWATMSEFEVALAGLSPLELVATS